MSRWPALRINHHCDDHGELLRDAVAPLVAEVRAREGLRILVRPDWSEGPHLLVAMDVDEDRFLGEIYEPCRRRIELWLQSNPSATRLDPEDYRQRTLVLAQAEAVPPGPDRLAPNNSVEASRYDRAPPIGLPELAALRDDFQVATLDLCLHLVALRLESRPNFVIELATLVAAAGLSGSDDYGFWPISMLAHGEAFLSRHKSQRASFDKLTAQFLPALALRWRDMDMADPAGRALLTSSSEMQTWPAALSVLNHRLAGLIETLPNLRDSAVRYDLQGRELRPYLNWDSASLKALMATETHLRYRIMINFVYGLFPLLGLKPVERAFLCHLVWTTVYACKPELIERADRSVQAAVRRRAA